MSIHPSDEKVSESQALLDRSQALIDKHAASTKINGSQFLIDQFDILLKQNMLGYVEPSVSRRLDALADSAFPPSNNMGGNLPFPPYFLPLCEKSDPFVTNKTSIDWLAFSSGFDLEAVRMLLRVMWPDVVFSSNSHGMPGYPSSDSVQVDGVQFGMLGYGAMHGRNFVSLTGTACKTLNTELISVLHEGLEIIEATLTRVDICFDLYNGERTFDHARWAYDQGAFKRRQGGRQAELKIVGTMCEGRNLGRTMYVGRRDGEVMARVYEKGLEVFAKMPTEYRDMSQAREIVSGVEPEFADTWLRLEVEYKRKDKDKPLPLDMLLKRDAYFAGAYPYFADALGRADGLRPAALKSDFEVDFIKLLGHAKRSYGSLIHSMKQLGFTDADVVVYLSSGRNNDKLVKSGLFAKMKEAVLAVDPDFDIPF